MPNLKRIQFSVIIRATPATVWHHITSPDSYRHWTAAFADGSYFQGGWEAGSAIRFLSPSGDGMISEIAESRPHEFISIRHRGFIVDGIEDTTSEAIRAWAPAYENYTLQASPEGTTLIVDQDVAAGWEEHLAPAWPTALGLLRGLCESAAA